MPPASCVTSILAPDSPLHPMMPVAALPGPWTKVHGFSDWLVHTLVPAVNTGVQLAVDVPSLFNSVPPQVLLATPRTQAHATVLTLIAGNLTPMAGCTTGMSPLRCLPKI